MGLRVKRAAPEAGLESWQDVPDSLPIREADWEQTLPLAWAFIVWHQKPTAELAAGVEDPEAKLCQNSNNRVLFSE